jgi:hypothetical protein
MNQSAEPSFSSDLFSISSVINDVSVFSYENNDGAIDLEEEEYCYYSNHYQEEEILEELPLRSISCQNYDLSISSSEIQIEKSWNHSILEFKRSLSVQQKCSELITLLSSPRIVLRFPVVSPCSVDVAAPTTNEGLRNSERERGMAYEKVICLNNKNEAGKRRRKLFIQLVSLILQLKNRRFFDFSLLFLPFLILLPVRSSCVIVIRELYDVVT